MVDTAWQALTSLHALVPKPVDYSAASRNVVEHDDRGHALRRYNK